MTFTPVQISDRFTDARKLFQECKYNNTAIVKCDGCGTYVSQTAQHWNDVGGPGFCEMCWVESIMCFWFNEDEAAQELNWDIEPPSVKKTDE